MKLRSFLLLIVCCTPSLSWAQWTIVAPNLLQFNQAAMCFRDGIVWIVGSTDIWMSKDTGQTWTQMASDNQYQYGYDCDFFDDHNGLVETPGLLFKTTDQGITWSPITDGGKSACFGRSSNVIAAVDNPQYLHVSTNGGLDWSVTKFPEGIMKIVKLKSEGFECLMNDPIARPYPPGQLVRSMDQGATWQTTPGTFDFDSFSFAIDSCDPNRIYVVNEDVVTTVDGFSQLFLSTDGGTSWQTPFRQSLQHGTVLCGSIALTANALYCPTSCCGVLRSTDLGMTWNSVGGPNSYFDTRLISAINDNIVLLVDGNGSVWRTTNGGGDSVLPMTTSAVIVLNPASLTYPDSIPPCTAETRSVSIVGLCRASPLDTAIVSGRDSMNFVLQSTTDRDSLFVTFAPDSSRTYVDSIVLYFADHSTRTIPLQGVGQGSISSVQLRSNSIQNDTIGATVFIPIIAVDRQVTNALDLSLHYDTSILVYEGTYLTEDLENDLTTTRSTGFARLHFDMDAASSQDSIIGYAAFQIFPTSAPCTTALFDSISITNGKGLSCASVNPSFTATICSKVGCGTTTLTDFLRYDKTPTLSIIPNPASGVTKVLSNVDLGQVEIELRDVLGNIVMSTSDVLSPNHPASLRLSTLPSGLFSIRVQAVGIGLSQTLMHLR
jgi:photosystem II stability/assembly factor-like uncharacterized protein